MSAPFIEHRGVVRRIEGGKAIVAMETGGCSSCGHVSACGVGKMAGDRPATLLTVPLEAGVEVGDAVCVGLPAAGLSASAVLGYLFPAIAMLLGAALAAAFDGRDGVTALGAMGGFLAALILARFAIALAPRLMPAPRLVPIRTPSSPISIQEFHHD